MTRCSRQSSHASLLPFLNVKAYIHVHGQGELAALLLHRLRKQTNATRKNRGELCARPLGRINTGRGRLTSEPLSFRAGGERAEKQSGRPPRGAARTHQQETSERLLLSWKVLLGSPALGGEKALHSSGAFQNRPVLPERLLTWAEMHCYIKNRNKTAHMDISGQPGFFPSLKCCLGGVQVREEGAFRPDPVRPGPS